MLKSPGTSGGVGRVVAAMCSRGHDERQLVKAFAADIDLHVLHAWPDFQVAAASAECAVAVIPWLDSAEAAAHLTAMRRRAPDTPLVVVTTRDFQNSRLALDLGIDDIIATEEIGHKLDAAVRVAAERSFLRVAAANALRAMHLPSSIRNLIATACTSRRPVRSTSEVALLAGMKPQTLWRAWRREVPATLKPKALLDWLLLLHAAARKTRAVSWEAIAEDLNVDEDTLAHIAGRMVQLRLSEIHAESIDVIREEFCRTVLTPLGIRAPQNRLR